MALTLEERQRRMTVWDAMSDLFVATETRWALPRVALTLAQSGYTEQELLGIWAREIVPECASALPDVAEPHRCLVLDEAALVRRAEGDRAAAPPERTEPAPSQLEDRWAATLALRSALIALPERDRQARASAWTAFVHVYLERTLETMPDLELHLEALRSIGASEAALVAMFQAIRDTLRTLLLADEYADEARRATDVRIAIGLATTR